MTMFDSRCLILLGAFLQKYHPQWYSSILDDTFKMSGEGSVGDFLNEQYKHVGMNLTKGSPFAEVRNMIMCAEIYNVSKGVNSHIWNTIQSTIKNT